ncbi:MAG: apolipoprotein N-acyltransferase [Candidatus Margulisiibacteriota bacterium]
MKKNYNHLLLAEISGILLCLAFPPFNLHVLARIALAPILWVVINKEDNKDVYYAVAVFAAVYFGGTLGWIMTINHWYPMGGWLAWLGVLLSGVFWMLLWAALVRICRRQLMLSNNRGEQLLFYFCPAVFWAFVEWVRQFGIFGSSLAWMGYTQWQLLPIAQLASITGVVGISYLLVMINTAVVVSSRFVVDSFATLKSTASATATRQQSKTLNPQYAFVIISVLTLFGSLHYGYTQLNKGINQLPFKAVVIQPNVPQEKKLDRSSYPQLKKDYLASLNSVIDKLPSEIQNEEIVFFMPETIIPAFLQNDKEFINGLHSALKKLNNSALVFGVPSRDKDKYYNSALVLANQTVQDNYNKVNLVPFGEYLPVPGFMRGAFQKNGYFVADYNQGDDYKVLRVMNSNLGLGICFESMLPFIYKEFTKKGAEVLAVLTNDAWFLKSAGPKQHLMASTFRAIENHRWFIQCANTGISAIIDPCGRIVQKIDNGKEGYIVQ